MTGEYRTMTSDDRILYLQVTLSMYLMRRWGVNYEGFNILEDKYNLISYIRSCYEPFHLPEAEDIHEEISVYLLTLGGSHVLEDYATKLESFITSLGGIFLLDGYTLKDSTGDINATREQVELGQSISIYLAVRSLIKYWDVSSDEALLRFMKLKTYALLAETDCYLCLESTEYILNMVDAELKGDWERWLEL